MRYRVTTIFTILVFFLLVNCDKKIPASEAFARGLEKLKEHDKKTAYRFFQIAAEKKPDNPEYQEMAGLTTTNPNAAFIHFKAAWANGQRTPKLLLTLASLQPSEKPEDKLRYSLSLFSQLPDSSKTAEFLGDIYFHFNAIDSSIQVWKKEYTSHPSATIINKISLAYTKKHDLQSAITTLLNGHQKKLLNSQGYIMLVTDLTLQDSTSEAEHLFGELKQRGMYTEDIKLEHAHFYLTQNRFDGAKKILETMIDTSKDAYVSLLHHRARIGLAYIYSNSKDSNAIKQLIIHLDDKQPWQRGERLFYSVLQSIIDQQSSSQKEYKPIIENLNVVRNLAPIHPVIDLVYARTLVAQGKYSEALSMYQSLPPLFAQASAISLEIAKLLFRLGKDNDALLMINNLHHRRFFSKESIELFRDISLKKQLVEKGVVAQRILEQHYPKDVSIRFKGALLSLQTGQYDSAFKKFSLLAGDYPDESKFEKARLSILLLRKDYKNVIAECLKSKLPFDSTATFLATAYSSLSQFKEAQETYLRAIKPSQSPRLLVEYADFLLDNHKNQEAAVIYRKLIEGNFLSMNADS
jgi:predicted Zn-dependent protease